MHPDTCETCHSELRGDGTCPMCDPMAADPVAPPADALDAVKKLEAENAELRETLVAMRELHIENPAGKPWSAKATFDGEAIRYFAAALCEWYRDHGGENYVEMHMRNPADHSEQYTVTVRKREGKTPLELRREAEEALAAERARLRGLVEGATPIHHDGLCEVRIVPLAESACDCGGLLSRPTILTLLDTEPPSDH